MTAKIRFSTPDGVMAPIGPYSHVARCGELIMISATAGVDPNTNELVSGGVASQTRQIIDSFRVMLASAGSDLAHILHVNVFLLDMNEFDAMNRAYADAMGDCRPARSAIGVAALPKPGARVTMNLTAVAA